MSDRDGPLAVLADRLRFAGRPPSLTSLFVRLEQVEEYALFVNLIREYLPEREQEILRPADPYGQIAAFASRFEDHYFPLHPGVIDEVEGYSEITYHIPVIVMGMSDDDYHEIPHSYRSGFVLMTYLLADLYDEAGGTRVPLAEACLQHVSAEIVNRVPQGGLEPGVAHRLLDGSPYEAVAAWADMLTAATGNPFLDISSEDLGYYQQPTWDRETVEDLTQRWREAEAVQERLSRLAEWLEEDPPARFGEMLDFVERRMAEVDGED